MQAKFTLITFACFVAMGSSASAQFVATTSLVWDASTPLTLASDLLDDLTLATNYRPDALDQKIGASLLGGPFALPSEGTPALLPIVQPPLFALTGFKIAHLAGLGLGSFERDVDALLANDIEAGNTFSIDPNSDRIWTRPRGRDPEQRIVRRLSVDTGAGREWRPRAFW
jgi:hypothetical protein